MNKLFFLNHFAAFAAILTMVYGQFCEAAVQTNLRDQVLLRHQETAKQSRGESSGKRKRNKHCNSCKKLRRIEKAADKLKSEAPKTINQKKIDKAGGALFLTQSGDYCVTEDIVGTLIIASDSVCLDLCCHTLNAAGAPNAIVADGFQALKVYNGRIINSTDAAILVSNCEAVELYILEMNQHALDAIRHEDSTDLSVHDVVFSNDESGERALLFESCNNISVNRCQATGFLSTIGAVIQLDSCNAASIQDSDVSQCTKIGAANVYEFTPGTALVSVDSSTGVDFVHVKVNNNVFNNKVPIDDQANHWRTAEAIQFSLSSSCSLHQCETSNNTDVSGSLATLDTEDFFLLLFGSDNCIVTGHQSNNNSFALPPAYFIGVAVFDSNSMRLQGCQANNNTGTELLVAPFETNLQGFWISSYFSFASAFDNVLRNCQANFNHVDFGGAGRTTVLGYVAGMHATGTGYVIDNCQANHNSLGDAPPVTRAVGFISSAATNTLISNSTADNNTGGEESNGISLHITRGATRGTNQRIINCSASSNGNHGISVGLSIDLNQTNADVEIIDTVCDRNGSAGGPAAGIIVQPVLGGSRNILIKGCQIYDTFSGGNDIAGINITNASNVVIEDTNIFNTASTGFAAHGILFNNLTDSKIIRTQLHKNQNSGVEILGNNNAISIIESLAIDSNIGFNFEAGSVATCSLVQDSRALNNFIAGFRVAIAPPLTVTFIGNEAQCNGATANDNYAGLAGLINLQELKLSDGSLTSINPPAAGAAALGARFTNLRVVP